MKNQQIFTLAPSLVLCSPFEWYCAFYPDSAEPAELAIFSTHRPKETPCASQLFGTGPVSSVPWFSDRSASLTYLFLSELASSSLLRVSLSKALLLCWRFWRPTLFHSSFFITPVMISAPRLQPSSRVWLFCQNFLSFSPSPSESFRFSLFSHDDRQLFSAFSLEAFHFTKSSFVGLCTPPLFFKAGF